MCPGKQGREAEEKYQVNAFQNDIQSLCKTFSLPEFDYADISQKERLAAAIKRWPLLAELAKQTGSV
ncbi:cellulose biosynthesis protein BcsR [Mangrovibacter yixingensis]|uniref:cellulose biosynthesis protein BcsR n=1 Tax=Mangrovibacter yixingensis TaxID=1529639 RepID=UPI001CFF4DE0|nr:cellulose biosynthesis protein BcsR [Mangrovibacter yixingensis]